MGNRKIITSYNLKIIAIVTMFIDHIGATIIEYILRNEVDINLSEDIFGLLRVIDMLLRAVGRIAFPLFIFMIMQIKKPMILTIILLKE